MLSPGGRSSFLAVVSGTIVRLVDQLRGSLSQALAEFGIDESRLLDDSGAWAYYLVQRWPGGDPELDGQVVRLRHGSDLAQAEVATPRGGWIRSDDLWLVLDRGEPGAATRISTHKARELLTRWVAMRRSVVLPDDVVPLGQLTSGNAWDYFLVDAPGGGAEPDLDGTLARHRPGTAYSQGMVLSLAGEWVADELLAVIWERGETERSAQPISEDVARWLATQWVSRGRLGRLPEDLAELDIPRRPCGGDAWEYFTVRPAGTPPAAPGTVGRHLAGTSLKRGFAYRYPGRWAPTRDLFYGLVLGVPRLRVEPMTVQQARREITRLVAESGFTTFPEGIEPLRDEDAAGPPADPDRSTW